MNGLKVEKESDYEQHKIQEDNIGFQMLKKAGWSEGIGLGDGGKYHDYDCCSSQLLLFHLFYFLSFIS